MGSTDRILLLAPLDPETPGNGLAHRVRRWAEALGRIGEVETVVVPTHGDPAGARGAVVAPVAAEHADHRLPPRAAGFPEVHGRAWGVDRGPRSLVVAVRADLGPFGLGVATTTGAALVVDLDDDDESFWRSRGDDRLAGAYRRLVHELFARADLTTSVAGFGETVAVPNSVPLPDRLPRREGSTTVAMVGNFGYPPNLEGARWLVESVWPSVGAAEGGPSLVLAGPGSKGLPHGVGFVPDVAELYAGCAAVLVPLRHGSGSRIKAIEAFAHAVPVVGTTVGLDGLAVTDGHDCLLADDAATFARHIRWVLDHPDGATSMGGAGRRLAAERYSASVVDAQIEALAAPLVQMRTAVTLGWAEGLDAEVRGAALVVTEAGGRATHRLEGATAAAFVALERPMGTNEVGAVLASTFGLATERALGLADEAVHELVRAGLLVHVQQGWRRASHPAG